MELLGLRWQDVDFEDGFIRVRYQLGRDGKLKDSRATLATATLSSSPTCFAAPQPQGRISILSADSILGSSRAQPDALNWRNVETRGFDKAVTAAKLDKGRDRKPVMHDCRHTPASLMIAYRDSTSCSSPGSSTTRPRPPPSACTRICSTRPTTRNGCGRRSRRASAASFLETRWKRLPATGRNSNPRKWELLTDPWVMHGLVAAAVGRRR